MPNAEFEHDACPSYVIENDIFVYLVEVHLWAIEVIDLAQVLRSEG